MLLFLLEKTALHMQDPFENRPTDTAMTAIASTIELNLNQVAGLDTSNHKPAEEGPFYQM